MEVFPLGAYKDPLRTLILAKHTKNTSAAEHLGTLMARYLPAHQADGLVPIPLYWKRYAMRGFNQASVIAYVLSKAWKLPVVPLLTRVKQTTFQAGLSIDERHKNSLDAFMSNQTRAHWHGKRLILVDDLVTTGATLQAAASALEHLELDCLSAVVACRAL